MQTKLRSLSLTNFKGKQKTEIAFNDQTSILGANATGKTTLFDAFTWLLFGKDSQDRKDFEIKPRKSDNTTTDRLDVEVQGVLEVNGSSVTLKRTYREKWVKPRGEETEQFTGHETLYEVNGVPMSMGDYKKVIEDICPESLFKLITSPAAFASLSWQDKRNALTQMAGDVTIEGVAAGNKDFERLIANLNGRDFSQFRKEINARKKKIKDELEGIDPRISEVQRSMSDEIDYEATNKELAAVDAQIQKEQNALSDISRQYEQRSNERREQLKEVERIEGEIRTAKNAVIQKHEDSLSDIRTTIAERKARLSELQAGKAMIDAENVRLAETIVRIDDQIADSRQAWHKVNGEEFTCDPSDTICPTCKRELDDAELKIDEMRGNFNQNKAKRLAEIKESGLSLKAQIDILMGQIDTNKDKIIAIESELKSITIPTLPDHAPVNPPALKELETKLKAAQDAVKPIDQPQTDRSVLAELQSKRDAILELKSKEAERVRGSLRIMELLDEKKSKGQALALVEKEEFLAEKLVKQVSGRVQESVNDLFKMVKFKMFKSLINGGEEPDCTALINGVPFDAANNAAKINAGIDIINALSKFHDKTAPIWVDNAEGVNEFITTESQLILLKVSKEKTLTVL